MSNNANMISIGFDNYVNFDRVIAVLSAALSISFRKNLARI